MTQKEKQLLLKDLCARLPYGVYVFVHDTFEYSTVPYENVYLKSSDISSLIDSISLNERYNSKDKRFNKIIKEHKDFLEFKPYLRPMSDMSEDERKYITDKCGFTTMGPIGGKFALVMPVISTEWLIDFYNSHHIDWKGLIPMGLALEAKEGMYKIESV